jgi:hypothetical protein
LSNVANAIDDVSTVQELGPHTTAVELNTTPDGRLLLATHGRGLWAIPFAALG